MTKVMTADRGHLRRNFPKLFVPILFAGALAVEGRTNRGIAQELFVTMKTVEMHLSNAYRKLDIRSRRELAAALAGA